MRVARGLPRKTAVMLADESAMGPLPDDLKLLTSEGAAKILGISEITLKRLRRSKKGPTWIKISDSLCRYRLSDLRQYINDQVQGGQRNAI